MNYEKLSAGMAALVDEFQHKGTAMLTEVSRAVPLASFDASGTPEVHAFVRCDPEATIKSTQGVRMHAQRGRARTALVSLNGVDQLSDRGDVYLISPAVRLKPLNDLAAQKTHLQIFRNNNHNGSGKDVVVGVVDSGIDATHPAFAGRIHSIWDQTISGVGWADTNYGTVLSGPTLVVSSDTHGHGTHVAGIAAGDDGAFGGVAPKANLVCVKTNFLNPSIGDGIRYIFAVADKLDCPAVVNLSLGGHHDAHDGSDDLSVLIQDHTGPGRVVVAAAGNEGGDDIHGAVNVPEGKTREILFKVPPMSETGSAPWVRLNGWYGGDNTCEISIQTSAGDVTSFQPVIPSGQHSKLYSFSNGFVRIGTPPAPSTPNGDHHFTVELTPATFANAVQGGTWKLIVRNTGSGSARIDVWSVVPEGARDAAFLTPSNSREMKIGSPGCAEHAITVGSFTSRNNWIDSTGTSRAVGLTVDTISDFSSPGPLRNGTQKPDVTAPGAMIVSCLSAASTTPPSNVVTNGFRVNAGTSMACPYITGLVALLLERDPTLDAAAIKTLLKAGSAIPGSGSGIFHPAWGFGLVDAGGL